MGSDQREWFLAVQRMMAKGRGGESVSYKAALEDGRTQVLCQSGRMQDTQLFSCCVSFSVVWLFFLKPT